MKHLQQLSKTALPAKASVFDDIDDWFDDQGGNDFFDDVEDWFDDFFDKF